MTQKTFWWCDEVCGGDVGGDGGSGGATCGACNTSDIRSGGSFCTEVFGSCCNEGGVGMFFIVMVDCDNDVVVVMGL